MINGMFLIFEKYYFPFLDSNVPRWPSYCIYNSQVIRFARVCCNVSFFNNNNIEEGNSQVLYLAIHLPINFWTYIIRSAKHLTRAKRSVLCFVMLAKPLIEFGTKAYYSNLILLESMVPCYNGLLIISKTENKMLSYQGSHLTGVL